MSAPAPTMRLVFRVDGDSTMGLGHLMRCRALAEALIAAGHRCDFVVAGLELALSQLFEAAGITIHRIELDRDRDAASTLALADSIHADGLIVDGYHFTDRWRLALRRAGKPILAFADGPMRPLHADLLIDAASPPSDRPTELFGPDYVLLRRELAAAAKRPPLPIAERRSILVTFGGSDPAALTMPTVKAVHRLLPETPLTVVVGGATLRAEMVAANLSMLGPRIDVRLAPPHMGELMRTAGLAISAAGGTVGELAAIGVPLVLAIVADNQIAGAAACAAAGWCTPIDARQDEDSPVKLAAAAAALWRQPDERERRAVLARRTVDPSGADRTAAALVAFVEASHAERAKPAKLTE